MGRKKAGKILMTAWLTGSCILTGCSAVSDRQEPVRQTTAAAESAETEREETETAQPQPAEAETIESRPAETAETSIRINPQEAQPVPEGMVVWNSLSFFFFVEEWQLTVYVSEEAMERGTFPRMTAAVSSLKQVLDRQNTVFLTNRCSWARLRQTCGRTRTIACIL